VTAKTAYLAQLALRSLGEGGRLQRKEQEQKAKKKLEGDYMD